MRQIRVVKRFLGLSVERPDTVGIYMFKISNKIKISELDVFNGHTNQYICHVFLQLTLNACMAAEKELSWIYLFQRCQWDILKSAEKHFHQKQISETFDQTSSILYTFKDRFLYKIQIIFIAFLPTKK